MFRSWKIYRTVIAAVALCMTVAIGCVSAPNSGIDPTGEHVFAASSTPVNTGSGSQRYYDDPMGKLPWDDVIVLLSPQETVAQVGTEMILTAGVGAADGYLRTNRRLEWTIGSGGVGQFVAVEKGGFTDLLVGDFNWPRKVNNSFAVGSTGRSNVRLNRGTPTPEDDLMVLRGQGWVSLSSAVEGTSYVTVMSPDVYDWNNRTRSAMVHWVDAQWQFPTPSINRAGTRHLFTTTVHRQSDQSPRDGWLVRYEIASGPPAGFAPDGAQVVEVPTNSAGQGNVEIFQTQPAHGTNQVCIQVIRPANLPGSGGRRLVVASGSTTKTWSAPDLAVSMTGPASANVGELLTYKIDVSNPGDLPADEVAVELDILGSMEFVDSTQPTENLGNKLVWRLGQLGARLQTSFQVRFRSQKQGSVTNCCRASAAGGLKANGCATTTVGLASIDVCVTGPEQATVGEEAYFEITITNLGKTAATELLISDRLDPGLELKEDRGHRIIKNKLGDLAPGESTWIGVTLVVTAPGRLSQTIEVSGPTVATASAQTFLTAVAAPADVTAPLATGELPGLTPNAPLPLQLKISGPEKRAVGEKARFTIELTNSGATTLYGLKVINDFDQSLWPELATGGHHVEDNSMIWTVEELEAGRTKILEIHYQCDAASPKAVCRATVELSDGRRVVDETSLEITVAPTVENPLPTMPEIEPPTDDLDISVIGLRNPVRVGNNLTYEIRVTNNGTVPYRQLSLTATVPEGMTPDPLGISPPKLFKKDGQTIRFSPIDELQAGKTYTYRVPVRTSRVGNYQFRVELTSPMLSRPLTKEAKTEVFLRN